MALTQIKFAPGIDKQDTKVGAQGRWVDSDNVRFRYGLPEKVGGWASLINETIVGVVRRQLPFVDAEGNRYVALGTDKFLLLYFEGQLFDITPFRFDSNNAQEQFLTSSIDTTNTSTTITVTTKNGGAAVPHGLSVGDMVVFNNFAAGSSGIADADLEGKVVQVITVPSTTTFTATVPNAASATSSDGTVDIQPYAVVGPAEQSYGYGFGISTYGGVVTGGSDTGWGVAVAASTQTLEPGLWSLDTFGNVLIATIANGRTYTWDSNIAAKFTTRASVNTTNFLTTLNPVASRLTLVSPTTQHLIHFGTCTTYNDASTQDDMFIRFSNNEEINSYDVKATNTAGTFRLQDGTKIMGALTAKETILVWTDSSLYTMKFVGSPFTFGFEQVGTNCGLIGKNAAVEIDGVAYWMSNNGFFAFDGTVKSLPCGVEDYVYDDIDTTKGQQICAGLNNLFTEVTWWYPTTGSDFNNRYVSYNYGETMKLPAGNWYTGTNTNSIRTSWTDTLVYPRPYATKYNESSAGTFPAVVGVTGLGQTVYFEHETGTDQINPDGSTTALTSFIQSFEFSLQKDQTEYFLAMRRFLPNFKRLTGNNNITLSVTDFPATDATATALSPFIVTSSTNFVDTRARGRYASIKLQNTAAGETWRFGTFQVDLQPDGRR
ncbi:MAG: hypothetical protein CBD88_08110 [Flavobacteriales bacterium TMED228]|nr:MAG: hypothetical protein CBD88_08110 [Flavobacteriales bacterium TMED228]